MTHIMFSQWYLKKLSWLLYFFDLHQWLTSNKVHLYANDVILYSKIQSIEECHSLQNDLNSLMEWSHKWQMHFYARKCEFLSISNKKSFLSFSYYINGCLIQEVSHARYFGMILNQHLYWNEHTKQIANKANAFLHRNLYQCIL